MLKRKASFKSDFFCLVVFSFLLSFLLSESSVPCVGVWSNRFSPLGVRKMSDVRFDLKFAKSKFFLKLLSQNLAKIRMGEFNKL